MNRALQAVRQTLLNRGIEVSPVSSPEQQLIGSYRRVRDAKVQSLGAPTGFLGFVGEHWQDSHAQLFQDLFALYASDSKTGGYFVEFGATDGMTLSNSLLLEQSYGWTGILAEPSRYWQEALTSNRRCAVDFRCVAGQGGTTITFEECASDQLLSSVAGANGLRSGRNGASGPTYLVETVTLTELLRSHGAPALFDYLSVDTEGTELEILRALDFESFRPRIITVEHNGEPNRSAIEQLLVGQGYRSVLRQYSAWDDWYVLSTLSLPDFE